MAHWYAENPRAAPGVLVSPHDPQLQIHLLLQAAIRVYANADNRYFLPDFPKGGPMLGWAFTYLLIALVAAAVGFGGVAGLVASIAQILFFVFIVLFLATMVRHTWDGNPPD